MIADHDPGDEHEERAAVNPPVVCIWWLDRCRLNPASEVHIDPPKELMPIEAKFAGRDGYVQTEIATAPLELVRP